MYDLGLTERLWPARTRPKDDELLSSWLMRLAMAHGLKLHTFCSIAWPEKAIWNRDIDKSANTSFLSVLAEKTGYGLATAMATTLRDYEGRIYEKHNPNGNTPWIMPIGIYHRTRTLFGLQFCPACLREDKEPYYRRKWRLAFVTVCGVHNIPLEDRCPQCGEALNFHRNELGIRRKITPDSMTHCHICAQDLKQGSIPSATFLSTKHISRSQQSLILSIERGWIPMPGHGPIYSHLYLTGLHQVMRVLATGKRSYELRRSCGQKMRIKDVSVNFPNKSRDIERLNVSERRNLFQIACWLLDEWPNRFIQMCKKSKVWSSTLLRDLEYAPFWFWRVVYEHLYQYPYSPSNQEIESAILFLRAKGQQINKRSISRCLGVNDVFRKRDDLTFANIPALLRCTGRPGLTKSAVR